MKVFLTGSTGFVGAHTTMELLRAGHELRLLVRDEKAIERYLGARGFAIPELALGDMRDEAVVREGMRGCDAVVHSAALVSLDARRADEVGETNRAGMRAVVDGAHALGIPNIVYVSSLGALFRPGGPKVDERSPLGDLREAYARSKRDCELHARELQARGAPIQITYPGAVFGPDDPRHSESSHGLVALLRVVPQTTSGIQFVDVRDLARAHRALVEAPPRGAPDEDRYVVGGVYHPWAEFRALLRAATGRYIPGPVIPGALLRWLGRVVDGLRGLHPIDFPISAESMQICTRWSVADSSRIATRHGVDFRPSSETVVDMIRSLHATGHVSDFLAGGLARKGR